MISSLLLCRKLHLFLGKSTKTAATRAAFLDSNMHQIVCRLRLRPRPHWLSLQRFSSPPAVFRGLFLKVGKGRGDEKRGGGKVRRGRGNTALSMRIVCRCLAYACHVLAACVPVWLLGSAWWRQTPGGVRRPTCMRPSIDRQSR